ncbi:hypothetical protein BIZ83_gp003 [Erwinia phage vB_EamM_ChrisDB]|uniref:hypothetical protein n=1 Tax=Erwinia phage vB_EamM_ChrisDB TaxID=1883371 RepID=UPI00081D18C3|nr:hypothetical protein BIZ83_gp003 [Erwinia phage vB_EamM_ChrisDB]ANZ48850.1 hypothetical protein CHRISDB_288 [Erwinia phage vB_EamM_ChrisDB]
MFEPNLPTPGKIIMSLTPEQKRRKAEELRRREQNMRGGSMSYYVDQSDDMVEAHTTPSSPSSCDSGSDSGGSCD